MGTLSDGAITKIPKLRAFIHEVLRIYPPAIIAGFREVTHDGLQMDVGDKVYDMPKGVNFWMNTLLLHHTPKHWVKGYDESNKAHREIDLRWQAVGGRKNPLRLQHPEGEHPPSCAD